MTNDSAFPLSLEGVSTWAQEHGISHDLALRRFAYYAVLECVAADDHLAHILIMRGASALWLFYNGLRISPDIDFFYVSLNGDAPTSFLEETRERFDAALTRGMPQYFPDFEQRQSWLTKIVRIDLNLLRGVPCDCCPVILSRVSPNPVKVATLEFILSEKLVAMLNDRKPKTREQDVLDIVSMFDANGTRMNVPRLAELIRRKSDAEPIKFSAENYSDAIRARLAGNYDRLKADAGVRFIPFDEAWDKLLAIVKKIVDAGKSAREQIGGPSEDSNGSERSGKVV